MSATELNPTDKAVVGGAGPDKGLASVTSATDKADAAQPGKHYTQAEVDAIAEGVRQTERKAQADAKAKAEMSEVDRLKLENDGFARENGTLKERVAFIETYEAVSDLIPLSNGVPRLYVKDTIQTATAEERKDPAGLAKRATDRWNADKGPGTASSGAAAPEKKAGPRAGTPAVTGSPLEAMSDDELSAIGRRTDAESIKLWREQAKPELRRRHAKSK